MPLVCALATLSIGSRLSAADRSLAGGEDPESFRIEITGSDWLLDSGGTVYSRGTVVNLISDLNVQQQQSTFTGRLVIKPGRKHRIVVDGLPFSTNGLITIHRTITYHGQTLN
jgi:hypothetical protein